MPEGPYVSSLGFDDQCAAAMKALDSLGLPWLPDATVPTVDRLRKSLQLIAATGDKGLVDRALQNYMMDYRLVIPAAPCWLRRFKNADAWAVHDGYLLVLSDALVFYSFGFISTPFWMKPRRIMEPWFVIRLADLTITWWKDNEGLTASTSNGVARHLAFMPPIGTELSADGTHLTGSITGAIMSSSQAD